MTTSPEENLEGQRFGPSDSLTVLFRACPTDPTEAVNTKLNHLLKIFVQYCTKSDEKILERVESYCHESKRWYYKILELLLQQESQRPGFKDVSGFLDHSEFQCSLVVFCLEITLCTKQMTYNFDPQLLKIFSLAPYNFWKVLSQVFVLHYKLDMTLDLIKHLQKVEEIILETLAWTEDSPLWQEIGANEGQLPFCKQVMSPETLEGPIRKEQHDLDPPQADLTSGQQSSTSSRRGISIYRFACKVYRLKGERLRALCSSLDLPDEQRLKIWTCFEFSLVHHSDIIKGLHLDHLLLCAIYAMTRNTRHKLIIKDMNYCYRFLRHQSKSVRNVLFLRGNTEGSSDDNKLRSRFPTPNTPSIQDQEKDTLTNFYSEVYMPVMEQYVQKLTSPPGGETPPLSPFPKPPLQSTEKYKAHKDFSLYVSGMARNEAPSPQSSGMSYSFQFSPSQQLRSMNNMIKSGKAAPKRGRALPLDEDGDQGPSAKILQRKLQEVQNDRMQSRNQDKISPCSEQH